jgi:hypothetical protein
MRLKNKEYCISYLTGLRKFLHLIAVVSIFLDS